MLTPEIRAIASALSLLVTRVRADHEHPAVAADDLALFAHRFDRGSYFHARSLNSSEFSEFLRPGSGDRFRSPLPRQGAHSTQTALQPQRVMLAPRVQGPSGRSAAVSCLMPRRQNAGTVGGDRDGEFEVGGQRAVLGIDR